MKRNETVNMQIRIAGEEINLNVGFDQQDDVRDAERSVCDLYKQWEKQFPKRSDKELLAMISYQFAYYYLMLGKRYKNASERAEEISRRLDKLMADE